MNVAFLLATVSSVRKRKLRAAMFQLCAYGCGAVVFYSARKLSEFYLVLHHYNKVCAGQFISIFRRVVQLRIVTSPYDDEYAVKVHEDLQLTP